MDTVTQVWLNIGGTFIATLVGAAVGAWVSYLFTTSASKAQEGREQARFDEQQRQARALFDEERKAIYRDRMDAQFEGVLRAAQEYQRVTKNPQGHYRARDATEAWNDYLATIDAATLHARGQDHGVLIGLRQYSQVPPRNNENLWMRLSLFMVIVGAWRRGEFTYDRVLTSLYRNSHDAPDGDWPPFVEAEGAFIQ